VEDVVPLAAHFLRQASERLGRAPASIAPQARTVLEGHGWEGNVRELRSVMERAALVCKNGVVTPADLPLAVDGDEPHVRSASPAAIPNASTLRDMERQILVRTLALADGNQSHAARILGLHESTLRFRLRRAGIAAQKRAQRS
jgi:DNA-binding NtrC family response regulator